MGLDYKVPKLRLFYLHIDQKSWELSIAKSSVKKLRFKMSYFDYNTVMTLTSIASNRSSIKDYIEKTTASNLETIQSLTQPKAIKTE